MGTGYSVVICTHNHADRLERTLTDLAGLTAPRLPWELLIVDNGCTDGTSELLSRYTWPADWQVRVVREEKLGLSNARNRGIAEAAGDYVIFMDDDETADPDWLCAYERLIDDKHPDAFGGRIRVIFEDKRPAWLTDELLGFLGELNRFEEIAPLSEAGTSFFGGNFGARRDVFAKVGGFNSMLGRKGTDNTGGEEVEFYRRLLAAGLRIWWTPDAVINHRIQATKLKRSYFLDLHYRMGRMEAIQKRGTGTRFPPAYIYGQLLRAVRAAWQLYRESGRDATLRKEMNVAYFFGYITGWAFGPQPGSD